ISQTTVKNVIGDTIVSNQTHGIYIGGQCTHIYDNVISGNNIGMEIIRTTIDSICGNTIASNKTSGVKSTGRGVLNVFSNNYIGTNSKFEALGNGEDGVSFSKSSSTIPTEFKNNIIGNNGRYGINLEASIPQLTIESCYVGVAPDSTPIPNAKGGLYINTNAHKTVLKNSTFAKNGGTGVKAVEYGELSLSGCSLYGNKGYGVYFASELTNYNFSVDNCVFNQNDSSAIYTSYPYAGEGSSYVSSSITNTLFLNTQRVSSINKAIKTNNPLPAPIITSIKEDENGHLVINGKVESEEKSFVELYLNDGYSETATKFLASDSTDAEGNFSIKTEVVSFSANVVATSSYSNETSELSKTYIYHNKSRKDYYVKVDGTGNGSSWENAMNGKDFVSMLSRVPDSVTFHIAAGIYDLKELSGRSHIDITKPTTIIGSYPADAKEGDVPTPFKNITLMKTGYFRLDTDGDIVFDGLKFENENYRGAYDANSYGKAGLCVTLKNSVVEGNESNGNAVYSAHGGKTILYNDSIIGKYTYSAVAVRASDSLIVKNCYITGAQSEGGILADGYTEIDSTTITGNLEYGVFQSGTSAPMATITNCIITNDSTNKKSIGIRISGKTANIKNNLIGIDANGNVKGYSIGIWIEMTSSSSIIEGNTIAGNDSIGIYINGRTDLKGNYIGTDRNFNNLGNGSDGLFIGGRCVVTFPSSLDSANYIGFNKGHGIYCQGNMTACDASFNYIGVTPQGDPMPNGKYGVYLETSRSDQTLKGNVIGFNGAGGVYYSDYTTITENLFFGTNGKAISGRRTSYQLAIPSIIQVKKDNDRILVEGTTDTFRVSTVELFATNGGLQTAHVFLGNTVTDSTGAFSFAIPEEKLSEYGDTICFSATATYEMGKTSNLSDPFCCENCLCVIDTTVLPVDTILVGESYLGQTYTEAGFYDDIFEVLKRPNGCDFVVKYSLVVLPNEGTGIENQLAGSKSIYPNPATNVLYVTNSATFSFMIQDMLGHTVMEGSSSNGSIDISDLPQGFYFLRLGDEGREGVFQFVKTQK
ncbi:MAG: right-handed parallel beta-helix repeat-containing protein, partial [Paludibacteraceae bacterium]|nr:right-handed parallel beta-helix repeat-containing protein [Paludibacteraceae bacterium]